MAGQSRAISSKISEGWAKSKPMTGTPSLLATRLASSQLIHQSGRACPGASMALRTRCTRRSELVKVPSFSAKAAAGRKTWASSAVSCMNRSWTTRQSSWRRALSVWWRSGSASMGFSPTTYMARMVPSRQPSVISVTTSPVLPGGRTPHTRSKRERLAGE